jgi:hypothetical protein
VNAPKVRRGISGLNRIGDGRRRRGDEGLQLAPVVRALAEPVERCALHEAEKPFQRGAQPGRLQTVRGDDADQMRTEVRSVGPESGSAAVCLIDVGLDFEPDLRSAR